MPITVKHSGNAAGGAVSSYAGGEARRQVAATQDADRRVESLRRDNFARKESAQRIGAATASLQASKDASALGFERQKEMAGIDLEGRRSLMQDRAKNDLYEANFTDKQRQDFNNLEAALQEAKASGEHTPEELAEITSKIQAQQDAMEPQRQLKKKSRWPTGQDVGETWTSEGGTLLTRNDKGIPVKLEASAADAQKKLDADLLDRSMNMFMAKDTGVIDYKKAEAHYKKLREIRDGGSWAEPAAPRASGQITVNGTEIDPTTGARDVSGTGLTPEQSANLSPEEQIAAGAAAKAIREGQLSKQPTVIPSQEEVTVDIKAEVEKVKASMNPTDAKMMQWAQANLGNPKAMQVLQSLQSKYGKQ